MRRAVSACFFKLFKLTISNLSHACLKRHSQYSDMRSSFRALVIRSRAGHEYGNRRVDEEQIGHSHNNTKKKQEKRATTTTTTTINPLPAAKSSKAKSAQTIALLITQVLGSGRRTSRSLTMVPYLNIKAEINRSPNRYLAMLLKTGCLSNYS